MLTGNSMSGISTSKRLAVYPRAYGEQVFTPNGLEFNPGLSPCLRGTGVTPALSALLARFIPVLTGNSCAAMPCSMLLTVYPRAYGEQSFTISAVLPSSGLSPCLRGTGGKAINVERCTRFIPVLTGNSY